MADTLTTLQQKIATRVDQTTTTPTVAGNEWEWRRSFINQAIEEWNNAYDWEVLRKVEFLTLTSSAQVTISLPSAYKKTAAYPINYSTGIDGGEQWPEIQPNEIKLHATTDNYYYVLGTRGSFNMIWNGSIPSGASIQIQYWSYPTSLVSPNDSVIVGDPDFIVDRVSAFIFESRNDGRFQQLEAKAREKLLLMVDNDNFKGAAYVNKIQTPENLYHDFRLGRD